jgi:hypothetical protein
VCTGAPCSWLQQVLDACANACCVPLELRTHERFPAASVSWTSREVWSKHQDVPACLHWVPLCVWCVAAGTAAPHLLIQQVTSVLLAAVAALSLKNIAGGGDVPPASMAELLRSTELREQLDKCECPGVCQRVLRLKI